MYLFSTSIIEISLGIDNLASYTIILMKEATHFKLFLFYSRQSFDIAMNTIKLHIHFSQEYVFANGALQRIAVVRCLSSFVMISHKIVISCIVCFYN